MRINCKCALLRSSYCFDNNYLFKTKITCLSTTFTNRKNVLEVMDRGHFDTLDLLESCEPKKMVSVVNRF